MLIAKGIWDPKTMVNVEELDPVPFLGLLGEIGLPTQIQEKKFPAPRAKKSKPR
jgi:saccharopine dehydrogenase-like NADP-dependent oxidoreductase